MTKQNIRKTACLPEHMATIFMDALAQGLTPPLDLISLLSQMALGTDIDLAKSATASLYGQIILPLCDDFTSHGVEMANSVLISMIQAFCRTQKGREARQILQDLHLTTRESFLARHRQLSKPHTLSHDNRRAVKKAFILSRVTLGADIAITSLIVSRLKKALPEAEIFLVGPDHLHRLFHNNGLHYLELPFSREGSFLERMMIWPRLYHLITKETNDLAPQEILLFDPDSRLSQLGLLPLTHTPSTHYLCSRQDRADKLSLSEITNNWLDHIFPDIPSCSPHFSINPHQMSLCQLFSGGINPNNFKIVINFGVGNDDNKRLADPFEEELLAALLARPNTLIILDSGKGKHEEALAKRLMAKMGERGYNTAEFSEGQLTGAKISFQRGLVRFTGKIDAMAGFIMASDLFIGYDSCGQHVATSTETPAIICFTGAPNKRFLERWQPGNHHGKTTTLIIDQKPLSSDQRAELIEKITHTADQYRS